MLIVYPNDSDEFPAFRAQHVQQARRVAAIVHAVGRFTDTRPERLHPILPIHLLIIRNSYSPAWRMLWRAA